MSPICQRVKAISKEAQQRVEQRNSTGHMGERWPRRGRWWGGRRTPWATTATPEEAQRGGGIAKGDGGAWVARSAGGVVAWGGSQREHELRLEVGILPVRRGKVEVVGGGPETLTRGGDVELHMVAMT